MGELNNAMESWIKRASRGAVHIGAVVLLVCLTLSSSMPTPTFNAAADVLSLPHHELIETHKPSTQSTELAKSEMSWDDKVMVGNRSVNMHHVENSNSAVLSTVQTSEEENRISTRKRRMSNGKTRQYSNAMKQLYSRTGYWLAIYDNETINGTSEKTDAYTHLRVTTAGFGEIKIRGVLSGMYVCMNKLGKLYPWPEPREECKFRERLLSTFYAVFASSVHSSHGRKSKSWYIGLNTNGKPRLGNKTKQRHHMAQFLLEPVKWDDR